MLYKSILFELDRNAKDRIRMDLTSHYQSMQSQFGCSQFNQASRKGYPDG
jgi:hypothetical protein